MLMVIVIGLAGAIAHMGDIVVMVIDAIAAVTFGLALGAAVLTMALIGGPR